MAELYDPNQDLTKICQSEFFGPEPEKIVVNGKEIIIKGRKRMDIIKDLLDSGADEECIVKGIESWWNNRHPREYLRAIKSKLKLKEAAKNEEKVDVSLKLNLEEKKEEGEEGGETGGELPEGELPELTEEGQRPIEINEEVVSFAYGALLEIVVRILGAKYKVDVDLSEIIPEERVRAHGKYYYQLLAALGLLDERYVQLFILVVGSAGALMSDVVAIITFFKSKEEEKGGKEEKKQWKGEGNKSDLNEKDKIKSQLRIMEEMEI